MNFFYFTVINMYLQGQATDIQIQAEEILKLKKQLNQLYVKHTNQPIEVIGELIITGTIKCN